MHIPKNSCILNSHIRNEDLRGNIVSIVDRKIQNVSIIKCNAYTIRSNHYHLTDWHIMHVLKGKIDYFYKNLKDDKINYLNVKKEQNIFTPAKEIHATFFPIDTVLIVCSKNPRDRNTYEKDTVRVNFINQNNIQNLLNQFQIK